MEVPACKTSTLLVEEEGSERLTSSIDELEVLAGDVERPVQRSSIGKGVGLLGESRYGCRNLGKLPSKDLSGVP